jgi:hypothetical protein
MAAQSGVLICLFHRRILSASHLAIERLDCLLTTMFFKRYLYRASDIFDECFFAGGMIATLRHQVSEGRVSLHITENQNPNTIIFLPPSLAAAALFSDRCL